MKLSESMVLDNDSYMRILDSLLDGLYLVDRDRKILYWNKASEKITGFTAGEVIGKQYRDKKAGKLSLGNAQRLGLAKALMHEPDILILDEPANGLDPAGIVEIRELLCSLAHGPGRDHFRFEPYSG